MKLRHVGAVSSQHERSDMLEIGERTLLDDKQRESPREHAGSQNALLPGPAFHTACIGPARSAGAASSRFKGRVK